jgi:predicted N-formylglutamate amidohydrolase
VSSPDTGETIRPLLEPGEPPAVELMNATGASSAVLVCDHASHRVPRRLGTLGLDATRLTDHIGWDPGAADVARRLAVHLDAPLVLSGYSRLVIDCNRPLRSADCIPQQSAGVKIPGNGGLSLEETASRVNTLYRPYHEAIERLLDSRTGRASMLLSIHSFTPVLHGQRRPWHVGISHGKAPQLAVLMREALMQGGTLSVGENQPYPIDDDIDYTIPVHGERRGLPSVMIEIRQNEIGTRAAAAAWAVRLAQAYLQIEAEALSLCA